jgi:hypothetical protein
VHPPVPPYSWHPKRRSQANVVRLRPHSWHGFPAAGARQPDDGEDRRVTGDVTNGRRTTPPGCTSGRTRVRHRSLVTHFIVTVTVTHPGSTTCPVLDTPDRSTTDHPRCRSKSIDSSVDDPATVTLSPHHPTGNLLIIPRRNPKIQPCTTEPCRMLDRGTLPPLPLKGLPAWGTVVEVGYGYPMPPERTRRSVGTPW